MKRGNRKKCLNKYNLDLEQDENHNLKRTTTVHNWMKERFRQQKNSILTRCVMKYKIMLRFKVLANKAVMIKRVLKTPLE